ATGGTPLVPTPIGVGPAFHPGATTAAVERGATVGRLSCLRTHVRRVGVHLECVARGRVVVVPAGIGIAPPRHVNGPYVVSGRCSYAARTRTPTGVIEVAASRGATLGDFFAVWGRRLDARSLAGFSADVGERVRAFLDGRFWNGRLS